MLVTTPHKTDGAPEAQSVELLASINLTVSPILRPGSASVVRVPLTQKFVFGTL